MQGNLTLSSLFFGEKRIKRLIIKGNKNMHCLAYHPANFIAYAFSSLKNDNDEEMRIVEEQR